MELTVFWEIFERFGIFGVLIAYAVVDKIVWPYMKKKRGKWVSYSNINGVENETSLLKRDFSDMKTNVAVLITKHEELDKKMDKELEHNFRQHEAMFVKISNLEQKR